MQINSRREYNFSKLDLEDLPANPVTAFENWLKDAETHQVPDYNAFHLATSNGSGHVSGRMVLLKSIENGRFIFYTDYESRKGQQIGINNYAAATFFWSQIERQVRLEGTISRLDTAKSDKYFQSRPLEARAAAAVSRQSKRAESREALEQRLELMMRQTENIERPARWGGYAIEPHYVEFWQGRPNRLNDRIVFEKRNEWLKYRLEP